MATRPLLVVFLSHETSLFGDETTSRCLFEPRNLTFWRRDPFSSPFLAVKPHFFGDETTSRRRFEPQNRIFWRRDHFSSSF
ncbi:hypothetical protein [Caldifermentibacillus hisashii]|uniref:hypothetical protein n=1 Tax=Caldifermentibacillus hisashii TaxID=996558 RepID=UPI003367B136